MEENKTNTITKYLTYAIGILLVGVLFYFVFNRLEAYTPPKKYTIEYSVTGSCEKADVTYMNYEGGTEQMTEITVPWTKEYNVEVKENGNIFLSISAQNHGGSGSVISSIKVNGETIKTSTSEGAYVVASSSTLHYFEKD